MLSGISVWQLLILLVIVLLVFGSKRLRSLGSDLGSALKGFRSAMGEEDEQNRKKEDDPQVVNQENSQEADSEQQQQARHSEQKTAESRDSQSPRD